MYFVQKKFSVETKEKRVSNQHRAMGIRQMKCCSDDEIWCVWKIEKRKNEGGTIQLLSTYNQRLFNDSKVQD